MGAQLPSGCACKGGQPPPTSPNPPHQAPCPPSTPVLEPQASPPAQRLINRKFSSQNTLSPRHYCFLSAAVRSRLLQFSLALCLGSVCLSVWGSLCAHIPRHACHGASGPEGDCGQ